MTFVTLVALTGCAKTTPLSSTPPAIAVPMRVHDSGHLFVPLQIGDRTFEFIVDTGASFTVISPQTQDALRIQSDGAPDSVAAGADGQGMALSIVSLPLVHLAGHPMPDVQAAVMPMDHLAEPLNQPVSGVLGQNILASYRVELDLQADTFTLSNPNSPRTHTGGWTVPFDFFEVAPIMRLFITAPDGQRIPAVFDSGAGATIVNQAAADALGAVVNATSKPSQATGANDTVLDLTEATVQTLQLSELELTPEQVYISDLGVFEQLGIADGPAVIIGVDLLDDRRLVLDYQRQTIWVSRVRP